MPKINFKFYSDFSIICQKNQENPTGALMAFSEFFQTWELSPHTCARLVLLALYEGVNPDVLQIILSIKPLMLTRDSKDDVAPDDGVGENGRDGEGEPEVAQETNAVRHLLGNEPPLVFMTEKEFLFELKNLIEGYRITIPTMKILVESLLEEEKISELVLMGDFIAFFHVANELFQTKFAFASSSNFRFSTESIQFANVLMNRFFHIKNNHNKQLIVEKLTKYFDIDLRFPVIPRSEPLSLEWLVLHNSYLQNLKEWRFLMGISDNTTLEEYPTILKNYFFVAL